MRDIRRGSKMDALGDKYLELVELAQLVLEKLDPDRPTLEVELDGGGVEYAKIHDAAFIDILQQLRDAVEQSE